MSPNYPIAGRLLYSRHFKPLHVQARDSNRTEHRPRQPISTASSMSSDNASRLTDARKGICNLRTWLY